MKRINAIFHDYYFNHRHLVFYTALKILKNHEMAEDITSEVFIKLYEYLLNGSPPINNIRPWLAVSAKRRAYNYIRDNSRLVSVDTDDASDNPFEGIDNRIFVSEILNRLYLHNQRWFDIMEKYYIIEMTTAEIACEYGCAEQAIRNVLHRAKKYLRSEYDVFDMSILVFLLLFHL